MAEANRALDDAVKAIHEQDRARVDAVLDFLVTEPAKSIARRVLVRVIEQAREEGASNPELARELAIRRTLATVETPEHSARDLQAAYHRISKVVHG